jgi:hypothetical protein
MRRERSALAPPGSRPAARPTGAWRHRFFMLGVGLVLGLQLAGAAAAQGYGYVNTSPFQPTTQSDVTLSLGQDLDGCLLSFNQPTLVGNVFHVTINFLPIDPCTGPHLVLQSFPLGKLQAGSYVAQVEQYDGSILSSTSFTVVPKLDLDLANGLFAVHLRGPLGEAQGLPISNDSGYFWIYQPGIAEAFVKILDGRAVNGHYWVFISTLSNQPLTFEVDQTSCGGAAVCPKKTYVQAAGDTARFVDLDAF